MSRRQRSKFSSHARDTNEYKHKHNGACFAASQLGLPSRRVSSLRIQESARLFFDLLRGSDLICGFSTTRIITSMKAATFAEHTNKTQERRQSISESS